MLLHILTMLFLQPYIHTVFFNRFIMPRNSINKTTKQPVRMSKRKGKGTNPRSGKQNLHVHSSPPVSDVEEDDSDHSQQGEMDYDSQHDQTQPGSSAQLPQATASDQMSPFMAQQIAAMIQEGISEAFVMLAPNIPATKPPVSTTPSVERGLKRPAPGSQSAAPPVNLSDETEISEAELEILPSSEPPIKQSFGLLVGSTLNAKLRQKIISEQYVEMYDLLPYADLKKNNLVLKQVGGFIKQFQEETKKFITIDQWNEAFEIYMSAYHSTATTRDQGHSLMLEMLTYKRDVNKLAKQNLAWYDYDRMFRKDRSVNPSAFAFSHLRHDLLAHLNIEKMARITRQDNRVQPNTQQVNNTQSQHQGGNQQSHRHPSRQAGVDQSQPGSGRVPSGYCISYHVHQLQCKSQPGKCKYNHACFTCLGDHPAYRCDQN